jgi:hypothetical protein
MAQAVSGNPKKSRARISMFAVPKAIIARLRLKALRVESKAGEDETNKDTSDHCSGAERDLCFSTGYQVVRTHSHSVASSVMSYDCKSAVNKGELRLISLNESPMDPANLSSNLSQRSYHLYRTVETFINTDQNGLLSLR